MQHLRQEATNHTSRVAALATLAVTCACALAFAVTGALAANPPDTSISAGPSGTYRSGSAQFTLDASNSGVSYECSLDGAAFEPCSSTPSYEVANGFHRLEARAVSASGTDPTPAARTWWADATFQNGNFETPAGGWTSQGFTVPGLGWSGGTLQVADGGLTGGRKAGRFTASGSSAPTISTSPDPVNASPAGVTYTAQGSVRGMTSGRTICLRLREYQTGQGSDTLVGSGQQCVTTNGAWQSFPTLTYTVQQAGSYIDALVYQTSTGAAGEIFYVDGLALSEPGSPSVPALPEVQGDPVLLGLADIASCWSAGDEATARLLDSTPGVIGIAGDTEQNHGEPAEFQGCYEPTWGRHKWRTKPAVGDHEYGTTGAAGYFSYFGSEAGQSGKGWYSYDLGNWHMVVLNSNCDLIGGCGPGSEQYEWLEQDLEANAGSCVGAYWHHPRWSAGATHGSLTKSAPFWELLYEHGAEFVYSGNDHTYQRFAPQTPNGQVDNERGMRQFVVGTGGTQHYPLNAPLANTQVQTTGTFGVLKLTLHASSYEWQFLPQAGRTFTDSGSTACSPSTRDTQAPQTTIDSGPSGLVASTSASLSFSADEAGSTFECKLDDGAWQSCSSPRALTGLAQGDHTFRVRATDQAGNTDASEAARSWTVDTVAPDTTIGSGPSGPTASTSASLAFSSEAGATFECKLDDGPWQACSSPRALTGLAQGDHTFRVRALDAAGNTDSSEATRTWTVDTVAPDTTIGSGPSGTVASTSATIGFGSDDSGAGFQCQLDGGAWQSCSSPRSLTGLAQGAHTFRVRAIDAAGNTDASEATRGWTVDTVAPNTTITTGPDALVASPDASLAFTAGETGTSFECKLDDEGWEDCESPKARDGLTDGAHTFRVRATDAAGNTDQTEATRTWTVDTVAPETTIASGPSGPTASTSASITFSSETGTTFQCKLDGGAWQACSSPRALTGLAQGDHTFRVRATDQAGNTDASEATRSWTVDTVAPETTIASGPSGTTAAATASFAFSSPDPSAGFECRLDDGGWQDCESPEALDGLSDGSHTFRVRATDAAGNTDQTEATRTWTVDTHAPETTLSGGPTGSVSSPAASFTFGSSEGGSSFQCKLDDGAWQPCSSPRSLTGLADGSHTFRVRAVDAAGNTDSSEATRTWTVDTAAPETMIASGPSGPTGSNSATLAFSSSEPASTFRCRLDDGPWQTCGSPRSLGGLSEGEHSLSVRAVDAAGNEDATEATRTWTVDTVEPNTTIDAAPEATTASNRAEFTFGSDEAGVAYECRLGDGAWDPCGAPHVLTGLENGEHDLQVRARDAAGNLDSSPATHTWTVDAEPPDTTITGGPAGTVRTTTASFSFTGSEAGTGFECSLDGGAWQACTSPNKLSGLALGRHTFAVRALDALGNADATEAVRSWTIERVPPVVKPPVDRPPLQPDPPAAPSMELITARLGADVSSGARTLGRAPARKLLKRRRATLPALHPLLAGTFSAKLTTRVKGRAVVLAKGTRSARAAGALSLRLEITRAGARALKAGRRPRAKLTVGFRDSAGRSASRVASLRLPG